MGRPNVNVNVGQTTAHSPYTYKEVILKGSIPFILQVNEPDCRYVVKWDFDLKGETVEIPDNCVLQFEGGSLNKGTVVGHDTGIESGPASIFGTDLNFDGTWNASDAYPDWFKGSDADRIENAVKCFGSIRLAGREYSIDRQIKIYQSFTIVGSSVPDTFLGTRFNKKAKPASILKAVGDIDSIILLGQNTGEGAYYYSVVVDGVTFTTDESVNREVNGIEICTPGGPSRPVDIHNCNFINLKYGIYIYRGESRLSTNVSDLHIHDNNISKNVWGVYIEGIHAIIATYIDNNVIEQNIEGCIHIKSETEGQPPAYGNLEISNNMLEANPKMEIESDGTVSIIGNYYELDTNREIEIEITGYSGCDLVIKDNTMPNSSGKAIYNIKGCIIHEFRDKIFYDHRINTKFDTCAFLSRPFGPMNEIYSCFACYGDDYSTKKVPDIKTVIPKNFKYQGSYCLFSLHYNDSFLYNQSGEIAAGKYRMVYYITALSSAPFARLHDIERNIEHGPYADSNQSIYNFIPALYRKKLVKYLTDIDVPAISSFSVRVAFRKSSAISEIGLYSLTGYSEIPSMEIEETLNRVVVGEGGYYTPVENEFYRYLSSTPVGSIINDETLSSESYDRLEVVLKPGDVLEMVGVCQCVALDGNDIVVKKTVDIGSRYWPNRTVLVNDAIVLESDPSNPGETVEVPIDLRVLINVYGKNHTPAYANTHYVPYRIARYTLTDY